MGDGTPLNFSAYVELVKEDIDWLHTKCPGSLERSHIVAVLNWSPAHEYPHRTSKSIEYYGPPKEKEEQKNGS